MFNCYWKKLEKKLTKMNTQKYVRTRHDVLLRVELKSCILHRPGFSVVYQSPLMFFLCRTEDYEVIEKPLGEFISAGSNLKKMM